MSKIGNPVVEVSKGISLNEKDYCISLLSTLKAMEKNYAVAMTEASNEWLYDVYKSSFDLLSSFQRELYILMFQKGWYQLESADSSKIQNLSSKLVGEYKGLSE